MRAMKNGLCCPAIASLVMLAVAGCSTKPDSEVLTSEVRPVGQKEAVLPLEDADSTLLGKTETQLKTLVSASAELLTGDEDADSQSSDEFALADIPEIMPIAPAIAVDEKKWPLFRGDSHSSGVAASSLPDKLDLLWRYRVEDGGFETTPAVVDGVVYVGDFDGKLHAVDAKSGEKKWEFAGELGFVASPSVYIGHVYIGDLDGKFYCINAKSGKKVWDFATEAQIDSSANFYKENVLIGSQDATLYCRNAATGKEVWSFTIDDQIRCTPTVVDNRCFLAGCDGKLHIIDLDKGKSIGDVAIDSPTGTTPAVRGQRVYFGTHAGDFFCIDWKNAKTVWTWQDKAKPSEFRSSAAVGKDHIIVGDRGRRLFALNPDTGEQLWEFPTKKNVDSSPVIVGERVFFGSGDGVLYALHIDTGKEQWKYEAGGGFIGSPAVAEGKLFIASEDGVLYCFGEKE